MTDTTTDYDLRSSRPVGRHGETMKKQTGPLKLTLKQASEAKNLAVELVNMEDRLRRVGLFATAVKLNMAVQRIGFEIDEKAPW
jgi:hypothetical protein